MIRRALLALVAVAGCSTPSAPLAARHALRPGLNVHAITADALRDLASLHVTQIRTTLYASLWPDSTYRAAFAEHVALAHAAGVELLVVVHGGDPITWAPIIADASTRWPSLRWQVGNEQDTTDPLTLAQYADVFAAVRQEAPSAFLVAMAAGGEDPGWPARSLLPRHLTPDAWAVHVYGLPPADALPARVASLRRVVGNDAPIWLTEFGVGAHARSTWQITSDAAWSTRQQAEWARVLAQAPGLVDRAYGYVWDAADGEGYTLTAATRAWLTTPEIAP